MLRFAAVRNRLLRELNGISRYFVERRIGFSAAAGRGGGRLDGKVALITGGASGLGKATAHQFIQQGAKVIIADIDTNIGPQTATELGPEAQFILCDVADEQQIADSVDFAVAHHGKLDIMYNNAGIPGPMGPPSIASLNLDAFDQVMRVNVRGVVAGIKHATRVMIPKGSGCILCTASISGLLGGLGSIPYTVSKFSIAGIVKSASAELCQHGIRVNCISPFAIPTKFVIDQFTILYPAANLATLTEIVNGLGELKGARCEEADVACAAVYLASDEAKYVTGHNLVVDGGFTCSKRLALPLPDQI